MEKAKKVFEFYMLCNKLKNVIRTGWINWNVERERVESVAEHVYGVQMLALAMASEYEYDVDLYKVMFMLAVHELEETVIGDLTLFQIDKKEKDKMGHEAVHQILGGLIKGETVENLILEFDAQETPEAKFAFQCDKMECDLQSKLYDMEGCVDLNNQDNNPTASNKHVKELLDSGMSFSEMWLRFGQAKYPYDENFTEVSNYAIQFKK